MPWEAPEASVSTFFTPRQIQNASPGLRSSRFNSMAVFRGKVSTRPSEVGKCTRKSSGPPDGSARANWRGILGESLTSAGIESLREGENVMRLAVFIDHFLRVQEIGRAHV